MKLELSQRKQAKMKLGLQGCSGSGKTMGALLIAHGLCGNWNKIAVIDTENYSASLYSHLGSFSVVNIGAPYSPEKYIEAIHLCEEAGMEVIIIDSISHEWEGAGGALSIHSGMSGNSFTNWGKITPRHNAFVQAILQSGAHIIGTIRSKQEYVLHEKNGKQVPEKVGLKGITREGMDYEFTIVLDIDIRHNVVASKDRTGLFMDKPEFKISQQTGKLIVEWCDYGVNLTNQDADDFANRIDCCNSIAELGRLYILHPQHQQTYFNHFARRKKELQPSSPIPTTNYSNQNISNGAII
ncbi:AAA family ATPase [Pinibacter aurantiacus]|uniref:ATP-binding protein n=1 Tax=Pinibacter aurantiacus TaxID=2851599 RepID=A0A9E2W880_9BACT|nr:AAA family ATPase [Pinibacter aurantiacus]MBV4357707.1 ATP-binding protein [Pinibacter aurantiacus]